MPFKLVAADGESSYDLKEGGTLVIGRAVQCDISIVDPTISRRHAELMPDPTGVVIKDLGSSNGTFVNSLRIEQQRC
jgi:pSer/pThr/pTyr-binding forkhead associated (FHA) protein